MQNAAQHAKIVNTFCLAFALACVVSKNPKTPKLSPMADDAITQGGIEGLGSLVYICGFNQKKVDQHVNQLER